MLSLGAGGIVSVASHIVGNKIKKMVDAFKAGNFEQALKWHLLLFPIFRGMFIATNPVPVKYLVNQIGLNAGDYRLPITGPTSEEKTILQELLKKIQELPEDI